MLSLLLPLIALPLSNACAVSPISRYAARAHQALSLGVRLNTILLLPKVSIAATPLEDIATAAAKIPGFGPTDIIYPDVFQGEWEVDKEIYQAEGNDKSQNIPNTFDLVNALLPLPGTPKRIKYKHVYSNNVLDRAISGTSFCRVLLNDANAIARWDVTNPNFVTISTSSGQTTEFKVTKRSMEDVPAKKDGAVVGYSEYARVAQVDGSIEYAVPKIFGVRTLVRLKQEERTHASAPIIVKGVERLYVYAADSLDFGEKPLITVKSRFTMTKL